ncbi:MAG: SigE family RNA polymerase sigma factor [Actinomycetota bacterium]|nr:SigE family RNA polymerase sigma factor [Actinomycetota bacterium]
MSDAEEFSWFYQAEFPAVVRTIFLILHDRGRAEEIAQESFIQLLSRWKKVSAYDHPDAWVRRVAIRLAIRATRRDRLRLRLEVGVEPPAAPGPIDVDLVRAIRTLSPAQRAAVVLFYFEDRPVAQVARILNCSDATAKVHLHRARKRLGQLLGEEVQGVS